jgi:hypothetical protein
MCSPHRLPNAPPFLFSLQWAPLEAIGTCAQGNYAVSIKYPE